MILETSDERLLAIAFLLSDSPYKGRHTFAFIVEGRVLLSHYCCIFAGVDRFPPE